VRVPLAYGTSNLELILPDGIRADVVEPIDTPAVPDAAAALNRALAQPIDAPPLRELVSPGDRVGVVVSDITRATPYPVMLPPLLEHLQRAGEIVFYVATGTHRPNTEQELKRMLGDEVVRSYPIIQNDCLDRDSHRLVGRTASGNDVWILEDFLECDVRIATGFIEPHFFAGFSGGGKAIMPGLALLETIQRNHSAAHMDHPRARWGLTTGNPLWEEIQSAALMAEPSFLLNVTLNRAQEITQVFAGGFLEAHSVGCGHARACAMAPVEAAYDIVVTSNSGAPLDLNLYQSVKGMSAAAQIVRPGGHIIQVADCWDGIPDHGSFGKLLADAASPDDLLDTVREPGFTAQDQWQAHILALILKKATVHFQTHNITDDALRSAFLVPCDDVSARLEAIIAETGPDSRVCVLPEGPQTIPYLAGN
jgi:nickel-dependent lactate racemase